MRGICKRFGATVALDDVALSVAPGEVHALVGENGAGKSTLIKVLSGAVLPDAGAMRLDGQGFQPRHPLEARRSGVATVYQELSLAGPQLCARLQAAGFVVERLKLVNAPTPPPPPPLPAPLPELEPGEEAEIMACLEAVKDPELRAALASLGRASLRARKASGK